MASPKHTTSTAMIAMASVVITTFVIAALFIGREILIPLALAALLSFLLSPLVTRLERWIGRIAATLLAVGVLFAFLGGVGWVLTRQILDLATRLPDYQENIQTKLRSLKMPEGGRFTKLNQTLQELKEDLPGGKTDATEPKAEASAGTATVAVPPRAVAGGLTKPSGAAATPTPVEIVESKHHGPLEQFGAVIAPLLGPLGTGALVLLLLLCMLLQREDLRGRLIRLMGSGNISATTRGMDDAARRVSRYLMMQFIVNATYGVVIAIGLYFIGVPNAFVWGVMATLLRFIPYVGPWIAAAFPMALSLAVTDNWTMPVLTIGLFVVVELLSNNVMEPMLYGASTGVSSLALIVAAVFWTWLWGAPGLVLATPLTVCLVVMGRHVPRLSMLAVLLSDEEALAPHEEFYHRLLTPAANDASEFADAYLKANSRTALCDTVIIPALAAVERDCKSGELETEQYASILQEVRDVIEDLGARPPPVPSKLEADKAGAAAAALLAPPAPTCRVLCLPVRAERDELAGTMLAQLLVLQDFPTVNLSARMTTGELLEAVEKDNAEAVCISVTPPSTVVHARYLCGKLRARFPRMRLIIGLWGATEQLTDMTARLRESGADEVVTKLADAVVQLSKYAAALAQEAVLLAPPSDETERLAELHNLHLLDTEAEPAFDRITTKLARILNVPMALITFVDRDRQFFKSQLGLPEDLVKAREIPRDLSVCSHVVVMDDVLVVEDLARDRRFAKNSLVRERGLRFYAGAPLRTAGGHVLGAICVLDIKPRQFSDHDRRLLQVMAEEVMEVINQRTVV